MIFKWIFNNTSAVPSHYENGSVFAETFHGFGPDPDDVVNRLDADVNVTGQHLVVLYNIRDFEIRASNEPEGTQKTIENSIDTMARGEIASKKESRTLLPGTLYIYKNASYSVLANSRHLILKLNGRKALYVSTLAKESEREKNIDKFN